MSHDTDRFRVYQIGFNRCGTSSFAYFFKKNGFKTAHWRDGTVAAAIELARVEGVPLLTHTDKFDVYTDDELGECWKAEWHEHIRAVRSHFEGRTEDLLQFDIERHGVDEITSFFSDLDLDPRHWQRRNASTKPS